MLLQLLVGGAVSVCNIVVHASVMTTLIAMVRKRTIGAVVSFRTLIEVMIVTVVIFMMAHTTEVFVWSIAYRMLDVAQGDLFYFAFVNYTTLGYGDITPSPEWRLLGPLTAMNGVLMSGWSTAVIFEILRRVLAQMPPPAKG